MVMTRYPRAVNNQRYELSFGGVVHLDVLSSCGLFGGQAPFRSFSRGRSQLLLYNGILNTTPYRM